MFSKSYIHNRGKWVGFMWDDSGEDYCEVSCKLDEDKFVVVRIVIHTCLYTR